MHYLQGLLIGNRANHSGNDVYLTRSLQYLCELKYMAQPVDTVLCLNNTKDPSSITSGTTTVYFCSREGEPQLQTTPKYINSYPGKTFNISAVVKRYPNSTTFGSVLASTTSNASIPHLQQIQNITSLHECSNLSYTVMYTEETGRVTLTLTTDKPLYFTWKIEAKVNTTGCPRGFQRQGQECGCVDLLRDRTAKIEGLLTLARTCTGEGCVCVCVCVCLGVFGCGLSMREGGKLEKVTKEGRVWAACVGIIACSYPGVHKKYL